MIKTGTFEIEESFYITGRGIVVLGYLNDFIPKVGMSISINILDKIEVFKIIGTSMGNRPKNNKEQFSVLIQTTPEMTKYISENKITNQLATILSD